MRVLHTADWRLGRAFHGAELLAEQAALLEQLAGLVREHRVDAVCVAGGLLAPDAGPQAAELLDHALGRFALDEDVRVVALAGAAAIGAGRGVLARVGVHLMDDDWPAERTVTLGDEHGPVLVHGLSDAGGWPRFAEGLARAAEHEESAGARRLLLARVPGGEDGGVVEGRNWSAFAACLLGGRRRAREVVPGRAWQGGWLIPEGFDSAPEEPTLALVEIDAEGVASRRELAWPAAPGLTAREGSLLDLLESPSHEARLRAVVTDEGLVPELARLRERFPRLLEVERPAPAGRGATIEELFAAWCERVEGAPLSELDRSLLSDAMEGRGA